MMIIPQMVLRNSYDGRYLYSDTNAFLDNNKINDRDMGTCISL